MRDVALVYNDKAFDIQIENNDLVEDDGLETAMTISVFTDKRVEDDDLPPGHTEKRGWWGDMFPDVSLDQTGSRLWILSPAKITNETRKKAEDFCRESLQWMIDDGIADTIKVESQYNEQKHLNTFIEILKPDGLSSKYLVIWEAQKIRRL